MSHTVEVKVEMNNAVALTEAARICGATVLGMGNHHLYSSTHMGMGVKLKGWQYPIVIQSDGTVSFDNFGGRWGNPAELDNLKEWYVMTCAQLKCQELGWYTEFNESARELLIHHPDGGTITVSKTGVVDANGFTGSSCTDATEVIERAIGTPVNEARKPEFNKVQLAQKESA